MGYEYGCRCELCDREFEPGEHIISVNDQLLHESCFCDAASEIMLDMGYAERTTYDTDEYDDYWDDVDFRIKDAKEEAFLSSYM